MNIMYPQPKSNSPPSRDQLNSVVGSTYSGRPHKPRIPTPRKLSTTAIPAAKAYRSRRSMEDAGSTETIPSSSAIPSINPMEPASNPR